MEKYEYKTIDATEISEEKLNELGKEGWRLVLQTSFHELIFIRLLK